MDKTLTNKLIQAKSYLDQKCDETTVAYDKV